MIGYENDLEYDNSLLLDLMLLILTRLKAETKEISPQIAVTASNVALVIMNRFKNSLRISKPVYLSSSNLSHLVSALITQKKHRDVRSRLYNILLMFLTYVTVKGTHVPEQQSDSDTNLDLYDTVVTKKLQIELKITNILLQSRRELITVLLKDSRRDDPYLCSLASLVFTQLLAPPWYHFHATEMIQANAKSSEKWMDALVNTAFLDLIQRCTLFDNHLFNAIASSHHIVHIYQFCDVHLHHFILTHYIFFFCRFNCWMGMVIALASYEGIGKTLVEDGFVLIMKNLKGLKAKIPWNGEDQESKSKCQRYLKVFIPCLQLISALFLSCPNEFRLHYQAHQFLEAVGLNFN
ncbi:hypothetical protein RFI_13369 [Reticulomyxa filosa]|uniref:Uncharacterized protein n=1 Tax=Reticulomyxa filosa TaxID=46433 RepID=X6NCW3_RETFI|nr:hypothetical protein RFI_13369 [Reticulomyxa filosa]|eukprot:ETO23806.1 hypothetical protein RFI_13369 [Reticulomyxa filosa]